jgi:hypothetical protein
MDFFPPAIEIWAGMADKFPLGVGNTELGGKRFGLAISQLAGRVRGRGGSEAYGPHRVKLPGLRERGSVPSPCIITGGRC